MTTSVWLLMAIYRITCRQVDLPSSSVLGLLLAATRPCRGQLAENYLFMTKNIRTKYDIDRATEEAKNSIGHNEILRQDALPFI